MNAILAGIAAALWIIFMGIFSFAAGGGEWGTLGCGWWSMCVLLAATIFGCLVYNDVKNPS